MLVVIISFLGSGMPCQFLEQPFLASYWYWQLDVTSGQFVHPHALGFFPCGFRSKHSALPCSLVAGLIASRCQSLRVGLAAAPLPIELLGVLYNDIADGGAQFITGPIV